MNTTTWYCVLVILVVGNASAMELNRWDEKAKLLPLLSTTNAWPTPALTLQGRPTLVNDPYQDAFNCRDVRGALLDQKSVVSSREEVRDGKTILQAKSVFQDSRIPYALGVLSMQEGRKEEALQQFMAAERAVGYKPHEMPVYHAACFARLLLDNDHERAYRHILELQKLVPYYPLFGDLLKLERQMLADVRYVPVLHELAQEGSVDAQFELLKKACHEATKLTAVEAQAACLNPCKGFFEKLDEYPEFRPLLSAASCYAKAMDEFSEGCSKETIGCLIELLAQDTKDVSIQQVQQLSCRALKEIANKGDIRVRCYFAAQDIQSANKSDRQRGFVTIAEILEKQQAAQVITILDALREFEIEALIKPHAIQGQILASCIWAQFVCHDLCTRNTVAKEEYVQLKKYAKTANTKKCTQAKLMQAIVRFCDLMIARQEQGVCASIANKCIEIIKASRTELVLEQEIILRASTLLDELAQQGQLDAQTWQLARRIQNDDGGKAIQEGTVTYCLAVAKRVLEAGQKELATDNGTRVLAALTSILEKGNCHQDVPQKLIAEARYLKSLYLFRLLHTGRETLGLKLEQSKGLDTIYLEANFAFRAGVAEAESFVKAVGLYRKALMLYAEGKDDLALDVVLTLNTLDLPAHEKELCTNFCTYALRTSAACGFHKAVAWHATTLIEKEEYALLFQEMTNACKPILQDVFAGDSLGEWAESLIPYARSGVFDAIAALKKKGRPTFEASRDCLMSIASLVQALTPHKMFSQENPSKEALLELAFESAKEAYTLSCKHAELKEMRNFYKNWLGVVCSVVGDYYADDRNFGNLLFDDMVAQRKNLERAEKIFLEGAALKHPQCITSAACIALDTPRSIRPMTSDDFKAHIHRLHEAAVLNDSYAGARLAEHLFDGPKLPFGCGYSLQRDIPKAIEIAGKTGAEYPECKRVIAYHCNQSVAKNPSAKGADAKEAEKLIDQAIMLLSRAANESYPPAYYSFMEMIKLGVCTPGQVTQIHNFLSEKVAQNIVDAMVVYGVMLTLCPERVDEGIALLRKAREMSDGLIGSAELLTVFSAHPDKSFLLFEAVDCAVFVMEKLEIVNEIQKLGIFKLLPLLNQAALIEEQREKALAYSHKLRAALEKVGIKIEEHSTSTDAVSQEGFEKVVQGVSANQRDTSSHGPALVRVPQLVTEEFLRGLNEMEQAFLDMRSRAAQQILDDKVLMEALEAAAKAENPLAQCLLSKVLVYEAEHNAELQEDIELKKKHYSQAVVLCTRAIVAEPHNTLFKTAYERAQTALCRFYATTYIPVLRGDREQLAALYREIIPLLDPNNVAVLDATNKCIELLAHNGSVEALFVMVRNYVQSETASEHDKALEAMYRCGSVYDLESGQVLQEIGLFNIFQTTIRRVQELADRGNKHAALVLVYWESFNIKCNNITDLALLKQSLKNVLKYCQIAKNQKLPAGIYCWYKGQLFNSGRMSRKDFDAALKELEAIAEVEVEAGELAMIMCGTPMEFPCGQKGLNDKRRCKKIAARIKDKSSKALQILTQYAQEDKEYKKFLLYKLEIVKRMIHKPIISYMELAQNCAVANQYPEEIIAYLQHQMDNGSVEAKLALAGIGIKLKKFTESMVLFDQVIQAGGVLAHLAQLNLAYAYLDRTGPVFDIQKAFEQALLGIKGLMASDFNRKMGIDTVQAFTLEVMNLLLSLLTQHDLRQKAELSAGLDDIVDVLASKRYYDPSSIEWNLLMALRHNNIGSAYWILKQEISKALAKLEHSTTKEVDKVHIGTAVSIILSKLQADAQAASKEGKTQEEATHKAEVRDLIKLIEKYGIIYHMIMLIPLESTN